MRLKKCLKYLGLGLSATLLMVLLGWGIFPHTARLAALEATAPTPIAEFLTQGFSKQANLTPQPPSLAGKGEPDSPRLLGEGPGERSTEKYWTATSNAFELVEQGKDRYQSGQYTEAVNLWKQAQATFANQGDRLNQAMVLSNLALAYQDLGNWPEANRAIATSLQLLGSKNQGNAADRLKVLAQALNTQGSLQLAQGKASDAFATWQQAANTYQQAGDKVGVTRSLLNQAQALRNMGLYLRACQTLLPVELKDQDCRTINKDRLVKTLQPQPDSTIAAASLLSLGDALRLVGKLQESAGVLQLSLAIAQRLPSPQDESAARLSLGNTQQALAKKACDNSSDSAKTQKKTEEAKDFYQKALDSYQQAATISTSTTTKIQAQLNRLSLLVKTRQSQPFSDSEECQNLVRQWSQAQDLSLSQIQEQLNLLPLSRTAVYAQINFAKNLMELGKQKAVVPEVAPILNQAVQQAKELKDPHAESYALGYLGKLYEQQGRWTQAKDLTEQALRLVQASDANDIAYRWQWQLGRIYKAQVEQARKQNKKETPSLEKAIAFYNAAFNTLQNLRRDLSASDPDLQFSFQEKTEDPVYRQLVDLLLLPQNPSPNLKQARQVIESLHVAALENFLQQPCASANPEALDQVVEEQAQKAAVIYPIILPDRLEVIFKLPGQDLQRYSYNPPTEEIRPAIQKLPLGKQLKKDPQAQYTFEDLVRITIKQLQLDLQEEYTFEAVKQESQQLYKWLIAPLRSRLEATGIKTLVFVLDGPLENIPMAALYDGKNYLIEKYAIAVSLGLQIPNPKPLPKGKFNVLAASLATPPGKLSQEFSKLDFVNKELDGIKQLGIPGTFLRDREFTSNAFNRKINESAFPVVHLATHGQFSVDPQDTFIINEDGKINVDQLDNMFRTVGLNRPDAVELLVFSACETASGDNRATLGIAGVTVKAGARSAIASLWTLDDESSSVLMKQFYQHLVKDNVSRAEALRLAQEALLKNPQYEHPRYWAPFILLGNWL